MVHVPTGTLMLRMGKGLFVHITEDTEILTDTPWNPGCGQYVKERLGGGYKKKQSTVGKQNHKQLIMRTASFMGVAAT
jgi:hypothetical protein